MATKKKISKVQILRIIIQILFFIILPGLYAASFAGIKTIYQGLMQGTFDFSQDFPSLIGALSIIPITLLLGRFFCGWMCAFGALGDWLHLLGSKVFRIKYNIKPEIDKYLKYIKFCVLILLVLFVWNFDWNLDIANPWNAFGVLSTVTKLPDVAYAMQYFAFGTILLLFIIIGSLFIERLFCRYLCPLGAVFALVSKLSIFKIKKPLDKCQSCRLCTKKCSMGIPLYNYDKVTSGECIQCFKCVSNCPKKNANITVLGNELNPAFAGALAITAMTGLYCAGNLMTDVVTASAGTGTYLTGSAISQTENGQYADGTYEGTGTGFRGATTKVSVTVENGYITNIEAISYGDDAPYFNRAFNSVTESIIDSQSTDVDAVSGATYSSNGIMDAVSDALQNTAVSVTSSAISSTTESTTTQAVDSINSNSSTSAYTDGTYTGTGTGFRRGTTTVSVTVSGGLITDIEVVSYQDDAPYFNRAYNTVISEIMETQSTNVDAVSGATFSSNGIMDAVADALN
ncbi:FMN-binding protein [Parasporobacterium paucivorans]|uniref:Polyferredoxin n=1 Tax=Parasporobacterium paucivorans DSM 15970 TaxID=1122934 RepID=A0A1M6L3A6_9FIRM|nr:FMN-binding protein [Parasporobacterium paucivorans]SHJ65672.1 Polyferredoxin [Parasporobacterium paucivorans DSM 15970]